MCLMEFKFDKLVSFVHGVLYILSLIKYSFNITHMQHAEVIRCVYSMVQSMEIK